LCPVGFRSFFLCLKEYSAMIALSFGNECFNCKNSEEMATLVIAPKSDFASLEEFTDAALGFLEAQGEYGDWIPFFKNRIFTPADKESLDWMKSRIEAMNRNVTVTGVPFEKAVHIIPPERDDITLGIETASEYIFWNWGTSV